MSEDQEQNPRVLGRLTVARALADATRAALDTRVSASSLVTRLRRLADQIESGAPKAKAKAPPDPAVMEVFLHWCRVTGRLDAKLTSDRRTRIEARLREFDADKLKRAIDGIAASPFHNGTDAQRNPNGDRHDRIEVVFRNGAAVERFADMPTTGGRTGAPRAVPSAIDYDPREHGDLGHLGGQYRMKHNLLLDVGPDRYEEALSERRA